MRVVTTLATAGAVAISMVACQPKSESKSDEKVEETGKVANDDGGEDDTGGGTDLGADLVQGGTVDLGIVSAGTVAVDTSGMALVGQANGTELESLQYRILSIELCEKMDLNGTGTSNPQGCMEIYNNREGVDYDTFGYDAAKADTTGYVDLQDPEAVKALSAQFQLNSTHVREYNWGMIYFAQPIKVKASVPLLGSSPAKTLFTKDVPPTEFVDQNNYRHHQNYVDNFTTGPAELAIVRHNNGGTVVKFGRPLVITEADITEKKNFKLDLVFNPDGIVKATTDGGQMMFGGDGAFSATTKGGGADPTYGLDVPMINFSPIVHAAEQKIVREQYLVHYSGTVDFPPVAAYTEAFDIRVELYSLKDDPAKGIYGIDTQILYTANTVKSVMGPYDPMYIVEKPDGEIEMQNHGKRPLFKGFKRLTTANAPVTIKMLSGTGGDAGGYCLPEHFNGSITNGDCEEIREVDVTYELISVDEL